MKAVIEIKNKQYLISEGDFIRVSFLNKNRNDKFEVNDVKLILDGDKIITDLKNAKVVCQVIDEVKSKKLRVFKYRRRKNSKTMKGHRQKYNIVKIERIIK